MQHTTLTQTFTGYFDVTVTDKNKNIKEQFSNKNMLFPMFYDRFVLSSLISRRTLDFRPFALAIVDNEDSRGLFADDEWYRKLLRNTDDIAKKLLSKDNTVQISTLSNPPTNSKFSRVLTYGGKKQNISAIIVGTNIDRMFNSSGTFIDAKTIFSCLKFESPVELESTDMLHISYNIKSTEYENPTPVIFSYGGLKAVTLPVSNLTTASPIDFNLPDYNNRGGYRNIRTDHTFKVIVNATANNPDNAYSLNLKIYYPVLNTEPLTLARINTVDVLSQSNSNTTNIHLGKLNSNDLTINFETSDVGNVLSIVDTTVKVSYSPWNYDDLNFAIEIYNNGIGEKIYE